MTRAIVRALREVAAADQRDLVDRQASAREPVADPRQERGELAEHQRPVPAADNRA